MSWARNDMRRWDTRRPGTRRWGALACVLIAFVATRSPAHELAYSVETMADGNIRIGGFYAGVQPIVGATVTVSDADGTSLFRAKLDRHGFAYMPATVGAFTLTIDDHAGHRVVQTFVVRAHQLDGRVRDLIAELGREPSIPERLRGLPRWLTVAVGLGAIALVFGTLRWLRSRQAARPAS